MTINEPIFVDCVFKNVGFEPRFFKWRNRTYRVTQINGRWHRRIGKFTVYCFAVTDEHNNTYEIEFNTEDMKWQLLTIQDN